MKQIVLSLLLVVATSIPCVAQPFIELGSSPEIALVHEGDRAAGGLGLGATYQDADVPRIIGSQIVFQSSLLTISPALFGRLYLNDSSRARAFAEGRARIDLPIVDADPEAAEAEIAEGYKRLFLSAGAGFQTPINDRVRIGGAVSAQGSLFYGEFDGGVTVSTAFRLHLQYALAD